MWRKLISTGGLKLEQQNNASKKLILSVLNSTATKREAKDYLNKYTNNAKVQNYCLLMVKHLTTLRPFQISQLAGTIEKVNMLGLKPIFVIPPNSTNISKDSELLDIVITLAGLNPLHLQNGLTQKIGGGYKSVLESQKHLFHKDIKIDDNKFNPNANNFVPIIKPMVYKEDTSTDLLISDSQTFLRNLCIGDIPRIDKFFIINRIGGIPSSERNFNSHVFINLSQEFLHLEKELKDVIYSLGNEDHDTNSLIEKLQLLQNGELIESVANDYKEHLEDLQLMHSVLFNLSNSSTGLITTFNAANLSSDKKNPLVYNVLTDRSLVSSSLPSFKRKISDNLKSITPLQYQIYPEYRNLQFSNFEESKEDIALVTTVLKKGINIKTFEFSTLTQYNSIGLPNALHTNVKGPNLDDKSKVDLNKIKTMIDKSFGRKLDLTHYLRRINGSIASIIVIGDYEGIAILTQEGPRENRFTYLDKFAIIPEMKSSSGISDIIFNLMFKKFPKELLWRSKKSNHVNKWYFQRSIGVLDLSINLGLNDKKDSPFKLFYHSEFSSSIKSFKNLERLSQYAKYIRDIQPSWES